MKDTNVGVLGSQGSSMCPISSILESILQPAAPWSLLSTLTIHLIRRVNLRCSKCLILSFRIAAKSKWQTLQMGRSPSGILISEDILGRKTHVSLHLSAYFITKRIWSIAKNLMQIITKIFNDIILARMLTAVWQKFQPNFIRFF